MEKAWILLELLPQQLINGLTIGSVYALIALGYTMVYGVLQLINFAHGDLFMLGAMVAVFVLAGMASASERGSVTAIPASTNTATIAPSMKRSPWAKLMSWRTP